MDGPMVNQGGSPMPDSTSLTQFYDDLKNKLNSDPSAASSPALRVGGGMMGGMQHPGAIVYKRKAGLACDALKDKCCKHIILDIYCKVNPLDDDYIAGHMGQMSSDVDNMLAAKGMTPSQYLTSCSEATQAPLLEFVLRAINNIGKAFMEEANAKLKDAQEQDVQVDPPEAPDPEADDDVQGALVDVKKDTEYENFIDQLKEKTIKKIVGDVSKIIADKKEEKDMTFDPQPIAGEEAKTESTVSVAFNYIQQRMLTENVQMTPELTEQALGMAIREATLNEMNACFNQPGTDFRPYATRIRMGRGVVISESATNYFVENGTERLESLYKEVDGQKYDVSNYEKVGTDGTKTPMTDQEAKKVLDPDGYKKFQSRHQA